MTYRLLILISFIIFLIPQNSIGDDLVNTLNNSTTNVICGEGYTGTEFSSFDFGGSDDIGRPDACMAYPGFIQGYCGCEGGNLNFSTPGCDDVVNKWLEKKSK